MDLDNIPLGVSFEQRGNGLLEPDPNRVFTEPRLHPGVQRTYSLIQ
jgi:hypothetical protein